MFNVNICVIYLDKRVNSRLKILLTVKFTDMCSDIYNAAM